MSFDGVVQVAPDSTGKKLDVELVSAGGVDPVQRQRAVLVGASQDCLDRLVVLAETQLAVLRAIAATLRNESNASETEEDHPLDERK